MTPKLAMAMDSRASPVRERYCTPEQDQLEAGQAGRGAIANLAMKVEGI
jgi:hypothetical protein